MVASGRGEQRAFLHVKGTGPRRIVVQVAIRNAAPTAIAVVARDTAATAIQSADRLKNLGNVGKLRDLKKPKNLETAEGSVKCTHLLGSEKDRRVVRTVSCF